MRLFADRCMPILQRDSAFTGPVEVQRPQEETKDDVFAPA